jgi:hypothetical protein
LSAIPGDGGVNPALRFPMIEALMRPEQAEAAG